MRLEDFNVFAKSEIEDILEGLNSDMSPKRATRFYDAEKNIHYRVDFKNKLWQEIFDISLNLKPTEWEKLEE